MTTMNVLDSTGATVAVEKPLTPGQAAMAASRPVVLASDQSSIPVAATLAAETTKVIGTVRTASGGIASGSVASGAVAAGAYAAGSLAAGAGVDGWDLTKGAIADAAVTAGATGSISAKLRSISRDLVSNIVLAAGTNLIGLFKLSDGTNTAAVKAASTAPVATDPALVVAISPNSWDVGSGTSGTKTQRVIVDSSQFSALQTAGTGMSTGYQLVALPTDQPIPNKPQATSNGLTKSRVVAAASTNATSLKASAGNVRKINLFNAAAYDVFFKFYNKASAPTVGTDTPVWTIPIKAGTGFADAFPDGEYFATGIAYAITKLQADSDTTVLVASDVTGQIEWI